MKTIFRDKFLSPRGMVEQVGSGQKVARDNYAKPLAYFDGTRTMDQFGRTVGYGDLTPAAAWDGTEKKK